MAVYFQGAELEDFVLNGTQNANTTTLYNASNARGSVQTKNTGSIQTPDFTATNNFWAHLNLGYDDGGNAITTTQPFIIFRSSGTAYFGVGHNGTGYVAFLWSGSAWVASVTGPASSIGGNTRKVYDIYVKIGTGGNSEFRLYVDGLANFSSTAMDLTFAGAVSNFNSMRLQCPGGFNNQTAFWSEVTIADYVTIGSKLVTIVPNGAGNYTGWTSGAYTAFDEFVSTADVASSGTINQRISATFTDMSALASGETITSLKVTAVMSKDAGGPQSADMFTRISAADYDGADQAAPSVLATYPQLSQYWATSPATSSAWTVTEINGAEFGVRSRT